MPTKRWAAGEEVLSTDFNTYVQEQVISTFPNTPSRNTAIPTPKAGMVTYMADTNSFQHFNGSAWMTFTNAGFRIRGGTSVQVTDGAGWFVIPISPPLGTYITTLGIIGDDVQPCLITSRATPEYSPGATQIVFRLYYSNGAAFANSLTRVNWLLIDIG